MVQLEVETKHHTHVLFRYDTDLWCKLNAIGVPFRCDSPDLWYSPNLRCSRNAIPMLFRCGSTDLRWSRKDAVEKMQLSVEKMQLRRCNRQGAVNKVQST
jgi:hypothetical protein